MPWSTRSGRWSPVLQTPTAVLVAWAHLMPMIVDNHVPPQPGSNADFLLGLRHGLRFVAEQIDALP